MKKQRIAPRVLGLNLIIGSSFFYGSYGIWTTMLGSFFGGYAASTWRSVIVLSLLLPLAIKYRQLERIQWRRDRWYLAGLVISIAFVWGPLYFAILHDGIAIASSVNYASILLGMFAFGRIFSKERFSSEKILATILGLAGIYMVFFPNIARLGWIGLGAATLSGIGDALNSVVSQRIRYNATQSNLLIWSGSAVANLMMALIVGQRVIIPFNHRQWLYMLAFAVCSLAASWSLTAGLKKIEAGLAGVLGLLEIVFSTFFGVFLFHEHVTFSMIIGIGLILSAAVAPQVVPYWMKSTKKKATISLQEQDATLLTLDAE